VDQQWDNSGIVMDNSGISIWICPLLLKKAIEMGAFPIKNGGSFHSFLYVYQRVS
jgi:hypothetical protein